MKRSMFLALTLAASTLAFSSTALAAPICTDRPQTEWLTEDQMKAKIAELGYVDIKVFQVSGSCYEIYAHTKDGKRAEVYFNPVTGEIVQNNVD